MNKYFFLSLLGLTLSAGAIKGPVDSSSSAASAPSSEEVRAAVEWVEATDSENSITLQPDGTYLICAGGTYCIPREGNSRSLNNTGNKLILKDGNQRKTYVLAEGLGIRGINTQGNTTTIVVSPVASSSSASSSKETKGAVARVYGPEAGASSSSSSSESSVLRTNPVPAARAVTDSENSITPSDCEVYYLTEERTYTLENVKHILLASDKVLKVKCGDKLLEIRPIEGLYISKTDQFQINIFNSSISYLSVTVSKRTLVPALSGNR